MSDPTNDVSLEHEYASAKAHVAHLGARLMMLDAEIADATSKLVRRVREIGGDIEAAECAEVGIYDGDDREAMMYCAIIAELEARLKV